MKSHGMTLLELTVAVAILSIVMGMLFMLSASIGAASASQDARVSTQSQARNAMQVIATELRQSATSSFVVGNIPGASVSYRIAQDADGNGTAVDVNGSLELSPLRTLSRDTNDLNNDGKRTNQLILNDGARVRVLANELLVSEDLNNNGVLDAGEDANGNHVLDRGLWFQQSGNGIQVLIQTQRRPSAHSALVTTTFTETIVPRNN